MPEIEFINPSELAAPSGYSYAVRTSPGRLVHFAGHTSMTPEGAIEGAGDIVRQFSRTLSNLMVTARHAGASASDFVRLRIYVVSVAAYRDRSGEIGKIYREHFGDHFPAMTLVEVSRLWDDEAEIEIEGLAVLPETA